MRFIRNTTLILGLLASFANAFAEQKTATTNDYWVFVERNPFNLRPPPKPAPPAPPAVVDETPVNVKLTGISTMFNKVRVMLVNMPPNEDPEYLTLEEGERESGIELLKGGVDIKAGTVRVNIGGNLKKTLSFDDDGLKGPLPVSKKAVAAKPQRTPPRPPSLRPGSRSGGGIPKPNKPPAAVLPDLKRRIRSGSNSGSTTTGARPGSFQVGIPSPRVNTASVNANGNSIRLNTQLRPAATPQPQRNEFQLSAAEQAAAMVIRDEENKVNPIVVQKSDGTPQVVNFPPLPPID